MKWYYEKLSKLKLSGYRLKDVKIRLMISLVSFRAEEVEWACPMILTPCLNFPGKKKKLLTHSPPWLHKKVQLEQR